MNWLLIIVYQLILLLIIESPFSSADDPNANDEIEKSTSEMLRLRGYKAIDYELVTTDGYILNLVRGLNPLINYGEHGLPTKDPLLFIHGSLVDSRYFFVNSIDARPRNYGYFNAGYMDLDQLNHLLQDDPASNSLVFTAMNFGHEVWLMNRRGSRQSLGHIDPYTQPYNKPIKSVGKSIFKGLLHFNPKHKSKQVHVEPDKPILGLLKPFFRQTLHKHKLINPRYWNFSLDEQIQFDMPQTIEFVLRTTKNSRVALVGHSSGSAMILMLLARDPQIASFVSKSLLWAPSVYPINVNEITAALSLGKLARKYTGPVPLSQMVPLMASIIAANCQTEKSQLTVCREAFDILYGKGGGQQNIKPGFLSVLIESVGSHEYVSLAQAALSGKMLYYDYHDPGKNMLAYGQPNPPVYDLSRIISRTMSIWAGCTDNLVPIFTVEKIVRELTVPIEQYYLNQTGLYFNHASFLFHNRVSTLINIPSLKFLESL